jgi:hypothetical protein
MMRFLGISAMHVDLKLPNGCKLLKKKIKTMAIKMPLSKRIDNAQNFVLFCVAFHFKR